MFNKEVPSSYKVFLFLCCNKFIEARSYGGSYFKTAKSFTRFQMLSNASLSSQLQRNGVLHLLLPSKSQACPKFDNQHWAGSKASAKPPVLL